MAKNIRANDLEVNMKNFKQIMITAALCGISLTSFAGEKIDEAMTANGINAVNVENVSGEVTIIGTDGDSITVKGELSDKAKKFVFKKDGNQMRISVDMPHRYNHSNNDKGSVFTVRMPKSIRMNFNGVSTDVIVKDLTNNVEVRTVSGDISAENLAEHIELDTVSGEIDAENLSGKIRLSTVSGDIEDKNSKGRLQLKAVSGDIRSKSSAEEAFISVISGSARFKLAEVEELVVTSVSGDVKGELTLLDEGEVKVSGVSSDISLAFQGEVSANFRLTASAGGDLENRLTNDRAKRAKYGPSSKLNFSTGNGSASVKGSVVSGEIRISER